MPRLRPAPKPDEPVVDKAAEPEVVVEAAPEIEVVDTKPEEPKQEDASVALTRQIEALRESEKVQKGIAEQARRERDDAIRQANDRNSQLVQFRKEAQESQADAISSALAAAKAEADKASSDVEAAGSVGDFKAQAEAYRRLARAEARMDKLEDGKTAIEAQAKEPQVQPTQQHLSAVEETLSRWQVPPHTKDWVRAHPDYATDPAKIAALNHWHHQAVKVGIIPYSPEYEVFVEEKEGLREPAVKVETAQPQQRTTMVSAPVSREVPSSDGKRPSGKITLTRDEQEAAKNANISLEEYAKQKQKYQAMRANGEYSDQR